MAAENKEMLHECWYTGGHDQELPKSSDKSPASPSPDAAKSIMLGVLGGTVGKFHPTKHFKERMVERKFSIFEVEYVIRNGQCIEGGTFYADYGNHRYVFRGNIDGIDFEAAVALSSIHDLIRSPLLILISGCFKTKSGSKAKTF